MELAAAILLGPVDLVESPTPVNTEETEHRQEDTNSDTGGTLEVKRIVVPYIRETVTRLDEGVRPDSGVLLQRDRIAQLHRELIIEVTHVTPRSYIVRCQRSGRVTAHRHIFRGITGITGHTVTSHIERLERRFGIHVVMPQIAELGAGHEHQFAILGKRREDLAGELPFVVFYQMVFFRGSHLRVVLAVKQRPRRRDLESEGELASAAGVDRVINRRTGDLEVQREVMARTVRDEQVWPVLHHIHLVAQLAVEREIVIRPAQTFSVTDRDTESTEVFVLVGFRLRQLLVIIAVAGIVVIVGIGVIEVLVRLLVAAGIAGLVGEIDTCGEAVRPFAAEPRLQEGDRSGGIINTVRARVNREGLSLALRHYAV